MPPPPLEILSDTIDDSDAYAIYEQALVHLRWSAILLRQETTIRIPSFRPGNVGCDPYLNPTDDEWLPVLDDYMKQNPLAVFVGLVILSVYFGWFPLAVAE